MTRIPPDPLVILPGFMADARGFMPQIVDLGRDRAVLLPMATRAEDTVEAISAGLLPALPEKFALLGHSLGGAVAIDLLRRMPERITRIALIATDPLSEPPAAAADRETRLVAARAGRLAEALATEWPEHCLAPTPWREEVSALALDMGLGLGQDSYLRQTRALQRRPDQQKTLRRIKLPALILAGRSDLLVPLRRAEFLAGLMPFGQLQVIEDAGHQPQLEQPETVNDALRRFLAGPMLLK
ncbi:alpha/beta fold hydrolase [Pseudogemmobacter sonorensis]|uniref:alpha/beta fold hydrolase n=1 Tax=Pseudogemmobacter sonorensis TaxID=2989681 RepID=UPI003698DAEB